MSKYKYILMQDFHYDLGVAIPETFVGMDKEQVARMIITKKGELTVFSGYAWDGTTLSPDFAQTYYPSLVHDVLYQFLPKTPLTRRQIDDIFLKMMREQGFKLSRLYYWGVRAFGGIFVKLTR